MYDYDAINDEKKSWRRNWFVKNILSELPVIGGFFQVSEISGALNFVGKSAFTLAASGAAIALIPTEMDDGMLMKFAKATAGMVVGMPVGAISYNAISRAGLIAYYECCRKRNSEVLEKETLLNFADETSLMSYSKIADMDNGSMR